MSLIRPVLRPVLRSPLRSVFDGGVGGGGDPGESLLSQARILVDWSDASNNGGRWAKNQNDPREVTPNLAAFPTGPIVNEAGSANPARTNNYANGPGGEMTATRMLSSGANQVCYICRPSLITPTLPNGTYSLRFRARANSGTGPHTINYGLASSYATGSAQDLDWTDPANDAATTFEREITFSGSSDIAIRLSASGADVLVDRIQFHDGPLSTMPAWADFVPAGGRKAFAFASSLALDADDLVDTTGQTSGMLVFDPDFPARHAYAEYTVMTVSSLNVVPSGTAHIVNQHPDAGGTTTANVLQCNGTAPYAGEVNASAGSATTSYQAANLAGDGLFISGHSRSATQHSVFIDTIPAVRRSSVFAGINCSRWTAGSFTNSNVSDLRGSLAVGKYAFTVIWDRALSSEEWAAAAGTLRTILDSRGISLATMTDYHVISGDSNGTRATGDWTQLVTARAYLSPQRPLIASITSVGGQGLDDLEGPSGRFALLDGPALLRGTDNGRHSLYHVCVGTNDWDLINASSPAAYSTRVQALIEEALALHERVHVMWYSLLPQGTANSGRENWETQRAAVNAAMGAWIGTQDRVHLADFGGAATIGDYANLATYYLGDGIHFNTDGDIQAAAISGAAVQAWRTALGIDA